MSSKVRIEEVNGEAQLHYDAYVTRGSLMSLRAGLPIRDPDFLYNYLKTSLETIENPHHYTPEDFGILHPIAEEFQGKSNEELLAEISRLRATIQDMHNL